MTFSSPLRHHDLTITSPSGREFLGSANVSMRAGIDEKLRWLFKIYDIDSNGQVSKLEITQMCTVSVARTLSGWYQGNHSVAMETRCRPPQTIKSSTRGNLHHRHAPCICGIMHNCSSNNNNNHSFNYYNVNITDCSHIVVFIEQKIQCNTLK